MRLLAALVRETVATSATEELSAGRKVQLANPPVARSAVDDEGTGEPPAPSAQKRKGCREANRYFNGSRSVLVTQRQRRFGTPGDEKADGVRDRPSPGPCSRARGLEKDMFPKRGNSEDQGFFTGGLLLPIPSATESTHLADGSTAA